MAIATSMSSWNMPSRHQRTSSSRSACVIAGRSQPRYTSCRRYGFATSGHGGLARQSLSLKQATGRKVPGCCGVTHPTRRAVPVL